MASSESSLHPDCTILAVLNFSSCCADPRDGVVDVVRELAVDGKIDVVAHSNGAMLLSKALDEVADLLRKIVLVEPGPKTKASSLLGRPKALVVWGDYIDGHAMWTPLKSAMAGAKAEELLLPSVGIKGNSHFPMSDRNSDEVWARVSQWLTKE